MMSNGPSSSRRSVHSGARDDLDGSIVLVAEHPDAAEALALQVAQRALQLRALAADDVRAEVAVGARSRCAPGRPPRACRARPRPRTGRARGRARPAARAPRAARWWRRRRSAARASGACPRCSAAPRTRPRSPPGRSRRRRPAPRQKSRRDHLGRLEVRAPRTCSCPSREAPISTTRLGIGKLDPHRSNTAICVGGPTVRVLGADRQIAHAVAVRGRRRRCAQRRTPRASTRSGGRGGGTARRQRLPACGCTRRSAS